MMNLFVPSSSMLSSGASQFALVRFVLCCRFQSNEGEGQVTTTVLVNIVNSFSGAKTETVGVLT